MKIQEYKIVAHRATDYPNARWMWDSFCRENKHLIYDYERYDFFRTRLINGEIHYFVPNSQWFEWTKGKTYWLDDELYHSDYHIVDSEAEHEN